MSENLPFTATDDDAFRTVVSDLIGKGAAEKRQLTVADYIELARAKWQGCSTDDVYAVKLLMDVVVQPEIADEAPSDMFCVLAARADMNGELIDAPPGYEPPKLDGVVLSKLIIGSPVGAATEPETPTPSTYLFGYFDILGFKALLRTRGLDAVLQIYRELLDSVLAPTVEKKWSRARSLMNGAIVPALMHVPVDAAYASDTLCIWVRYHPSFVQEFFLRCATLFCEALAAGVPTRGVVTVGDAVLHKKTGIYLGEPLVEAARLEKKLNWVGVILGASFKSPTLRVPMPPAMIIPFAPPIEPGVESEVCELVLDWPRVWRSSRVDSPVSVLEGLCLPHLASRVQKRYKDAIDFVRFSEANDTWFVHDRWPPDSANRGLTTLTS